MDWEPEIPGQFETPRRISRKRTAADTGFLDEIASAHIVAPIAIQPTLAAGDYLIPLLNLFTTTFRTFHQLCSATALRAKATYNKILGFNSSKRVIEIRQLTADGKQSVKRRATESGIIRPVAPTPQQISRNRYHTLSRKSSRKLSMHQPKSKMASSTRSLSEQGPSPQDHRPLEKEAMDPQTEYHEPTIDREALGAKLLASFTPRPLPGLHERQRAAQVAASTPNDISNIHNNVELVSYSSDQSQETRGNINGIRSFTSSQNALPRPRYDYGQMQRSSLNFMQRSNELLSKDNESNKSLRTRRSQTSSLLKAAEEPFAQSVTTSKTPKQVRFAINPSNGQPFGTSKRFYRESIVGEWAPSSPWSEEQARDTMSDLKAHLESLEAELLWAPPPSTPISENCGLQRTNIEVAEELYKPLDPMKNSQPPTVISQEIAIEKSAHKPNIDQTREDAPSSQHFSPQKSWADSSSTPILKGSPYLGIKELLKSVGQLFSPTLPSPKFTDWIDSQTNVQEAIDTSIDMTDAPPIMYGLQSPPEVEEIQSVSSTDSSGKLRSALATVTSSLDIQTDERSTEIEPRMAYVGNGGRESAKSIKNVEPLFAKEQENGGDVFLEDGMARLRMSETMKTKISRRRREREAQEAAKEAAEKAAAEKAKAEAEEAARKAISGRRLPRQKLVQPLSKAWAARIDDSLRKGDHVALSTTVNGTELKRKDFMTVLGEREWLNDEIINAYLEWIVEYANKKAGKNGRNSIPKVIGLNSFFYKNLSTRGPSSISRWMTKRRAGGKKLLEVEIVLIPVNNANHWTIIVVSPKERTIEYLDSFAGNPKVFVNHTKAWLAAELGNAWKEDEWRVLDTKSTEQLNGYDCGVFTITNAECVTGGIVTDSYDSNDMAAQRRRIAGVLLNRGFDGEFIPAEDL